MVWIRARSDEQIEQRIRAIVEATARLYEENRFEDITFAMIAREANFTRSNLYRYFQTKEDIFLELLEQDLTAWRRGLLENFAGPKASMHEVAEIFVDLIPEHKRMVKLFTILFTLLEPNSSLAALTSFKQKTAQEIGRAANFLSTVLPFPSAEAAGEFISTYSSLVIGTYPMMDLTSRQKQAMDAVGMTTNPEVYRQRLVNAIEILLQGLTDLNTN